jgi:hypothetical protein
MMMHGGVEEIHEFILTLDRGDWSASHPSGFTCKVRDLNTCWIGGWVGPRAGLDTVEYAPTQD